MIWGGEFGRTPMGQGSGRDHHINSFSIWLAGGGIRGGMTYGATDELGYRSVENVVSLHDLHATMLQLCGIDHQRFSFKFQGLDARLTGVDPANVVRGDFGLVLQPRRCQHAVEELRRAHQRRGNLGLGHLAALYHAHPCV